MEELAVGPLTFRHEPSRKAGQGGDCEAIFIRQRVSCGAGVRCVVPVFVSDGERLIMPAFGAYTGALSILDRAFRGLFTDRPCAPICWGEGKVYQIARGALYGGLERVSI